MEVEVVRVSVAQSIDSRQIKKNNCVTDGRLIT